MASYQASYSNRFPNLAEGMVVYSKDGGKLGKVTNLLDDHFIVEKGFFFPKDFSLRYDDIQEIREETVYLNLPESELSDWRNDSYAGWQYTHDINSGRYNPHPLDQYKDRYRDRFSTETKVPVMEEELRVDKANKEVGEVKVKKVVHSELRHFSIPVMKEEVRVERVPVSDQNRNLSSSDARFENKTVSVPVSEEQVTISKRPVVKEEVRISKERKSHDQRVEGEVRKEEVKIEGEDELRRKKAG